MKYISLIFCIFFGINSICQINIDNNIIKIVDTSIIIAKKKGIDGYKIQIYMGSDRQEAEKIRKQFIKNFPKIKTYYVHIAPYYKIRVGKYYSKRRAYRYLRKINKQFKNAYIINVKIK